MYRRILLAVDTSLDENNIEMQRTEQIAKLTGATVYLVQVSMGHIASWGMEGANASAAFTAEQDADSTDLRMLQRAVDHLSDAGIQTHGELVSAIEHDIAEVILDLAKKHDVDLIVLGSQHHRGARGGFRSSVAEQVIHQHPPYSILLARPSQRA